VLIRSSFIINASGPIGGNYFQRDGGGLHIKAAPRHVQNMHPARKATESYFQACLNAWRTHSFSTSELNLWAQYCHRHPFTNRVGDKYTPTVQLMFMRMNLIRVRNGLAVIYVPPAD